MYIGKENWTLKRKDGKRYSMKVESESKQADLFDHANFKPN
jgi:hypothetical protein